MIEMPQMKPLRSVSLWEKEIGANNKNSLWSGEGTLEWNSATSTTDYNSSSSQSEEDEEEIIDNEGMDK